MGDFELVGFCYQVGQCQSGASNRRNAEGHLDINRFGVLYTFPVSTVVNTLTEGLIVSVHRKLELVLRVSPGWHRGELTRTAVP